MMYVTVPATLYLRANRTKSWQYCSELKQRLPWPVATMEFKMVEMCTILYGKKVYPFEKRVIFTKDRLVKLLLIL